MRLIPWLPTLSADSGKANQGDAGARLRIEQLQRVPGV
jgi:hypothetical protein